MGNREKLGELSKSDPGDATARSIGSCSDELLPNVAFFVLFDVGDRRRACLRRRSAIFWGDSGNLSVVNLKYNSLCLGLQRNSRRFFAEFNYREKHVKDKGEAAS